MTPSNLKPLGLALALGAFLLPGLGCGGSRKTGDQAGTGNWVLRITPDQAAIAAGQTLQFQAATPWGGGVQWAVEPASAGTMDASGLFTASSTLGSCTILAVWSKDVRYTASTSLTVLTPPPAADSTPGLVQAPGSLQTTSGGAYANGAVAGESVPAITSASANATFQVRHGFLPGTAPSN